MDMGPLTFELKESYDASFTYLSEFSKVLSEESLSSLNTTIHVGMSRLNSTSF